jgi:hypothetical protein
VELLGWIRANEKGGKCNGFVFRGETFTEGSGDGLGFTWRKIDFGSIDVNNFDIDREIS